MCDSSRDPNASIKTLKAEQCARAAVFLDPIGALTGARGSAAAGVALTGASRAGGVVGRASGAVGLPIAVSQFARLLGSIGCP